MMFRIVAATVTVVEADIPPLWAVIVAAPSPTAVTVPSESTVATDVALDRQTTSAGVKPSPNVTSSCLSAPIAVSTTSIGEICTSTAVGSRGPTPKQAVLTSPPRPRTDRLLSTRVVRAPVTDFLLFTFASLRAPSLHTRRDLQGRARARLQHADRPHPALDIIGPLAGERRNKSETRGERVGHLHPSGARRSLVAHRDRVHDRVADRRRRVAHGGSDGEIGSPSRCPGESDRRGID